MNLFITKTDLADAGAVARLRQKLRWLNPAAPVIETIHGAVDAAFLIGHDIHAAAIRMTEARHWMQADHAGINRHGGGITCFCLRLPGKLDWSAFGLWFSMLAHRHGDKLLRVNGILDVEDSETPVALHAVQHIIHAPEHLPEWPDAERGSRIVFITQGLPQGAVERSLLAFHRLGAPGGKDRW